MLAKTILGELESKSEPPLEHDSSTNQLIRKYRRAQDEQLDDHSKDERD